MAYRKGDFLVELKRIAQGKKPNIPANLVAEWARAWAAHGLVRNDVLELERLYRLEDSRIETENKRDVRPRFHYSKTCRNRVLRAYRALVKNQCGTVAMISVKPVSTSSLRENQDGLAEPLPT